MTGRLPRGIERLYVAVSALLAAVALVAVAVPSLRATRIDPNIALR